MRIKPILIVGIALFGTACATLTGKGASGPATPGPGQAQGNGSGQGFGSEQQGPSLNGDVDDTNAQDLGNSDILSNDAGTARPAGRATGVKADAVRVVGGQLFSGAPPRI